MWKLVHALRIVWYAALFQGKWESASVEKYKARWRRLASRGWLPSILLTKSGARVRRPRAAEVCAPPPPSPRAPGEGARQRMRDAPAYLVGPNHHRPTTIELATNWGARPNAKVTPRVLRAGTKLMPLGVPAPLRMNLILNHCLVYEATVVDPERLGWMTVKGRWNCCSTRNHKVGQTKIFDGSYFYALNFC